MVSGMHSAASLLHKMSVWNPLGGNIAVGHYSSNTDCVPLYIPDMLAALVPGKQRKE